MGVTMNKVLVTSVVAIMCVTAPVFAQDAAPETVAPEPAPVSQFAEQSVDDLNNLLRVNPMSIAVFEELQRRAEAGDVTAMMRAGNALRWGHGVPKNVEASLPFFRAAAESDSAWGMVSYGDTLYEFADGDARMEAAALNALRAAFNKGHDGAAYSLSQKTPTDWAMFLQRQLVDRGYYLGQPDGVFGSLSQNALNLFCEDRQVAVDCGKGAFDRDVVRAVFKAIDSEK